MIVVISAIRRHGPIQEMASLIMKLQEEWAKLPLNSSLPPYACELTATKSKAADALSDKLQEMGNDLIISQTPDELSVAGRIEATKELMRNRKLLFPRRWRDDHELSRLIRHVLAYPYLPDDYDLQALGGAVSNAQEIEFLDTPSNDQPMSAPARRDWPSIKGI
jgi:hypothetical protein